MDNKTKMLVFCFRAYNDIDNMVPIVYRFKKEHPKSQIKVILFDPNKNYKDDYRIRYIRNLKVEIIHILQYTNVSPKMTDIYFKIKRKTANRSRYNLVRIIFSLLFLRHLEKKYIKKIDTISATKFFRSAFNGEKGILIFDYTENPLYEKLCKNAQSYNVVTMVVPHGVMPFENHLLYTHQLSIAEKPKEFPYPFQHMVFTNHYHAKWYEQIGKIETDKNVGILGSARFCDEWVIKLREILPCIKLPKTKNNTIKVVFMLSKFTFNIFREEVERTIEFLSKFEQIFLIVMPHTRGMKFINNYSNNVYIAPNDTPSPILIDWADLILFNGSSVILDGIQRDKPVLYLKRTIANKLIFEKFIKTWEIECRDDLRDFVYKIIKEKAITSYTDEEKRTLVSELIEPTGKDVLGNYVKFIDNILYQPSYNKYS